MTIENNRQSTHHNNYFTEARTPERRKSETSSVCMYQVFIYLCIYIRTFAYDVRVQSLYVNTERRIQTEGGQTNTERKHSSVRMASLIDSRLAKIS